MNPSGAPYRILWAIVLTIHLASELLWYSPQIFMFTIRRPSDGVDFIKKFFRLYMDKL